MQNIILYLKSILNTYWGQSRYQLLLYLSIGIILLIEKKDWKRITFGWYGILCFIGLMNPITVKITSKIWGENVAYYCRQISLIPVFIIIAYGIVLVLYRLRGMHKMLAVILMTLCICVNGNIIYSESWYTKAENFNKIPNEVIEIADFFQNQDESIRLIAPTSVSAYLRQYYNIVQLQGRYVRDENMEAGLLSDDPDVDIIMQHAGEIECDYIVVKGKDDIRNIYESAGYTACFRTENYLVYKVEGIERWKRIYDKKNQMVEKIFVDGNDNVISSDKGYAIVKYYYDLNGELLSEHYFDSQEQKIALYSGEYGVSYKYDEKGHKIQISYLDKKDKLLVTTNGYAIVKYVYDEAGKKTGDYYYNENEEPVSVSKGQYGQAYEYYKDGKLYKRIYLDQNGDPMMTEYGYAIVQYTYDENGNVESEHYFDADNNPISLSLGQYGVIYKYQNNTLMEMEYVDDTDEVFDTKLGYARVKYIYDSSYNNVGKEYYDLSGNEVMLD